MWRDSWSWRRARIIPPPGSLWRLWRSASTLTEPFRPDGNVFCWWTIRCSDTRWRVDWTDTLGLWYSCELWLKHSENTEGLAPIPESPENNGHKFGSISKYKGEVWENITSQLRYKEMVDITCCLRILCWIILSISSLMYQCTNLSLYLCIFVSMYLCINISINQNRVRSVLNEKGLYE